MAKGAGLWRACGALLFMASAFGACKRAAPSPGTTPTAEPSVASGASSTSKPAVTVVLAFGSEKIWAATRYPA